MFISLFGLGTVYSLCAGAGFLEGGDFGSYRFPRAGHCSSAGLGSSVLRRRQAVNAYAEPVVSMDLDIAVAVEDLSRAESLLRENFEVREFAHSLNVGAAGSDLRVQLQKDPRYSAFASRSRLRNVLGLTLPVAAVEDVLCGKVWAVQDSEKRPSKRQKDLADIARLLETHPRLRELVPPEVLARLF